MSAARAVAIGIAYFDAGICADQDCQAIYDVTEHRNGCPNCSEPGFLRLAVPLAERRLPRRRPLALAR